jgi:CheY-like chemotaxis protein
VAASGSEALQQLSTDSFDLIVCDLIMPGMSGMELYEEVARRAPAQAQRFVFLTGGTSNEAAREFLARVDRPRAYKPIDVSELRRLVDSCLPQ